MPPKGKAVLAYAPHCPVPREERWYAVLADAPNNAVLTWTPIGFTEAEALGIASAKREQDIKKVAESSNGLLKQEEKSGVAESGTFKMKTLAMTTILQATMKQQPPPLPARPRLLPRGRGECTILKFNMATGLVLRQTSNYVICNI